MPPARVTSARLLDYAYTYGDPQSQGTPTHSVTEVDGTATTYGYDALGLC